MKKLMILTVILGLVFGLTAYAASGKKGKPQTKCPICKMDINKNLYVDYKGKRVYFGCEGCPAEFKKNPEKYIKQMEEEGIILEKAPANSEKAKSSQTYNNCKMHMNMNMNDKDNNMMNNKDKKMMMNGKMMHKHMMNNKDKSKCTWASETKEKGQLCPYHKAMMEQNKKNNEKKTNTNEKK